ncbi:hypothetical protein JOS77_04435 [Chromobacterium haemolyticum]|nr:hypothetical protein JOS77_04435 [Chromobacterium haemolyticum]
MPLNFLTPLYWLAFSLAGFALASYLLGRAPAARHGDDYADARRYGRTVMQLTGWPGCC